ncbi:MAG: anion permease [Elusimicrobiota bacterium]
MTFIYIISTIILFAFALTNGMHSGSNIAATAIGSSSMSKFKATAITAVAEFTGPLLLGSAVAMTISNNIIDVSLLENNTDSMLLLGSGIFGALLWNFLTWWKKLPSSSSSSLIGGLIGPFICRFGFFSVQWIYVILIVALPLILSPLLGIIAGFTIDDLCSHGLRNAHIKLNKTIKKLQIFTLVFLGANHGSNDSQKIMGMMLLLNLVAFNHSPDKIPLWIRFLSITGITLGVILAGTKIIRTVGYSIFKIQPRHALESQLTASGILLASNLIGAPVSTTQIISSSVIGVGSCTNKKKVHWQMFRTILGSWILTIPMSAFFSAVVYLIFSVII